ncbi:MAG: adenosine kinase [Acidobacteriota bacterium]|nr:adenosine kinase [Acidobacteriota bacterium]
MINVLGIGNAIVDVLCRVEDADLERWKLSKGSMQLIDQQRALELEAQMGESVLCSGGSAANTIVGVLACGSPAAYIGKVADDAAGRVFAEDMRGAGAVYRTAPLEGGAATARCLIYVTPDAQRTMMTFLGASAELTPDDVDAELVADAKVTYLEGYLFDPPPAQEAFFRAAELAHRAGREVALSLSDAFCVERHRDAFRQLVDEHVDLLFANEAEICSLYRVETVEEAVGRVGCRLAALTRGEAGATIVDEGRVFDVPAAAVEQVVDTTGAGDAFAAGFLHAYTSGKDPARAGRQGAASAAAIITRFGGRPD